MRPSRRGEGPPQDCDSLGCRRTCTRRLSSSGNLLSEACPGTCVFARGNALAAVDLSRRGTLRLRAPSRGKAFTKHGWVQMGALRPIGVTRTSRIRVQVLVDKQTARGMVDNCCNEPSCDSSGLSTARWPSRPFNYTCRIMPCRASPRGFEKNRCVLPIDILMF